MARYLGQWIDNPKPELVFKAAEFWRDRCLLDNRSVFIDDKELWNKRNFQELQTHFIKKLEEGEGNFFSRLETQLKPAPPEAKQLAAEIFWVIMLMPYRYNIGLDRKIHNIKKIWDWSGEPFPEEEMLNKRSLIDCLGPGIAHMGTKIIYPHRHFYYFIIYLRDWKKQSLKKQQELIKDYQKFGQYLQHWEDGNWEAALQDTEQQGNKIDIRNATVRQIILYLLFPDYFETIFNKSDKEKIITAFDKGKKRDGSNWIDDKLLFEIRQEEEERRLREGLRKDFHFYDADYQKQWNPSWQ